MHVSEEESNSRPSTVDSKVNNTNSLFGEKKKLLECHTVLIFVSPARKVAESKTKGFELISHFQC